MNMAPLLCVDPNTSPVENTTKLSAVRRTRPIVRIAIDERMLTEEEHTKRVLMFNRECSARVGSFIIGSVLFCRGRSLA